MAKLRLFRFLRSLSLCLVSLVVSILILFQFVRNANSAQVTLAWNPNTEPDVAGYRIYYGFLSGQYSYSVDVGNQTSYTLSNLQDGKTYYFAATAYDREGNESGFSNEVNGVTPELTQAVSGYVRTSGGSGISGVVMNGLPGNPSTSADGSYSGTVDDGWSGAVTPTKSGHTFSPSSVPYSNVTSNQTQNYTASLQTFTISGTVTSGGSSLSDVTMNGLPGSPVTDASGNYLATVDYGWSGTITPTKGGYNFSPPSQTYTNVTSIQTQNYVAILQTFAISGTLTSCGDPLSGVVMGGLPGNPVTDGNGAYTGTVTYGWSGTVTPTKSGYTFGPSSQSYSNVTSNQSQNYTGSLQTFTVSGYVRTLGGSGISGVVMSGLPGNPSTSADGSYSGTVDDGWSGTVTPTKTGYNFSPPSTIYSYVSFVQIQNYAANVQLWSIFFFDDFSTDKGWVGYESGGWERGPAIGGGVENGYSDPGTDYSGLGDNYILGFAIGGDYPNDLVEKSIISPPIDCTGQDQVFIKFRRWLNVESSQPKPNVEGDHARIYVSTNGSDWTQVWENPPIDLIDNQWTPIVLDISSIAANQATVYTKFTMGPTNSSRRFSGWNIDDFEITSEAIYPAEGTLGTELTITGFGFGAKKGRVFIGGIALRVLEWTDDFIHAVLSRPIDPGVYDVTIQPRRPKGTPSIIVNDGFAARAAEIYSVHQSEGPPYDQVTINGKFFGTKKGKVYLECGEGENPIKKSCKVNTWTMDQTTGDSEIVFVVPKMLPKMCDVVVDPYGAIPDAEGEEKDGFTVEAPKINSIEPGSGSVGEQITIYGNL